MGGCATTRSSKGFESSVLDERAKESVERSSEVFPVPPAPAARWLTRDDLDRYQTSGSNQQILAYWTRAFLNRSPLVAGDLQSGDAARAVGLQPERFRKILRETHARLAPLQQISTKQLANMQAPASWQFPDTQAAFTKFAQALHRRIQLDWHDASPTVTTSGQDTLRVTLQSGSAHTTVRENLRALGFALHAAQAGSVLDGLGPTYGAIESLKLTNGAWLQKTFGLAADVARRLARLEAAHLVQDLYKSSQSALLWDKDISQLGALTQLAESLIAQQRAAYWLERYPQRVPTVQALEKLALRPQALAQSLARPLIAP